MNNESASHSPTSRSYRPAILLAVRIVLAYIITAAIVTYLHPYLTDYRDKAPLQGMSVEEQNKEAESKALSTAERRAQQSKGWQYDFSELPDGPLPQDDWNFEVGTTVSDYNNEAQAYTDRTDNIRVEDGVLIIEAKKDTLYDRQYTSARINTLGIFDFTHGTLEVEIMLPQGKGTWPAAWLMPADEIYKPSTYGVSAKDPHSWVVNGEIDFMEAIGSIPNENIPAAHSYNLMKNTTLYTPGYVPTPYTQFHTYGVIKSPNKIEFTIDGKVFATRTKTSDSPLDWPFEQPYYLILNLALGGDWAGADGIDDAYAPWQMKVKSITYTPLDTTTK